MITIFANSGHHFHFVPLSKFVPKAADARPGFGVQTNVNLLAVETLCNSDAQPWSIYQNAQWIRFRPGRKLVGITWELGFWVAIESNLGSVTRGLVHEFETNVPASEIRDSERRFAFSDENQISVDPMTFQVDITKPGSSDILGTLNLTPIQWIRPNGAPIDVDLIVDFGNTRTIALLLENRPNQELENICRPVRFVRRGTNFEPFVNGGATEDPNTVVDSWIVLHETIFSDLEPPSEHFKPSERFEVEYSELSWLDKLKNNSPRISSVKKTTYMPQMFSETSPAILGGGNGLDSARQILRDTKLAQGKNIFLSSPKRYAWDGDQLGQDSPYWNIEINRWNPDKDTDILHALPQLKGPVCLFMYQDGRHWDLDSNEPPPNERVGFHQRPQSRPNATFPRRDSLTWAALTILETAFKQICSQEYRDVSNPYIPRKLRQVVVTLPSGWTMEEIKNYRQQWQKAINIFSLCHYENSRRIDQGGSRPILNTDLDEAVASQLPVIYSEATRLDDFQAWLELVGRKDDSVPPVHVARIMNIDIGGGTTDVSVVEYRNHAPGHTIDLNAKLLFKNSSTIAGDSLVKEIIERVLLKLLSENLDEDEKVRFGEFFKNPRPEWTGADNTFRQKIGRIVPLVLVPIVHFWLQQLTQGRIKNTNGDQFSPDQMIDKNQDYVVEQNILNELNSMARKFIKKEILDWNEPLNYDPTRIEECIRNHFTPLFDSLGKLVAAYDCDLVLVSGKPSELPLIQELLQLALPVAIDRIRSAKGLEVGTWYPISRAENRITDAKSITVVGAALHQAMKNGLVTNWRLTFSEPDTNLSTRNFWGVMPPDNRPDRFIRGVFLKPDEDRTNTQLMINQNIGRMRFLSSSLMPDQLYRFRWRRGKERLDNNLTLNVSIKRIVPQGELSELLELLEVQGTDAQGNPVTIADVELQLKTLPDNAFWMDNPKFNVQGL